jgi:hypothetical protein
VALRGVLHHASGDPDNVCEALDEAMNAAQRDGFTAFTRVLAARSHSS